MGIKVNQETLQMIADLSNARGASGFEDETVQAAAKHIGEGYTTEEDCLRNFYMYRTANSGNKPVFMLDAHSDEVGFMVHSIRPNGTLRFVALGGWNGRQPRYGRRRELLWTLRRTVRDAARDRYHPAYIEASRLLKKISARSWKRAALP